MTEKPQCGPEPDNLFTLAQSHVQALQKITEEIQLQTRLPDLPTLSQLVLQRDETIRTLSLLDLQALPQDQQSRIAEQLTACRELDPEIEEKLNQMRRELGVQVRGLQVGKDLINKYKINNPQSSGQNFQDA